MRSALWATVLLLGLRRFEVCGLHWSDVDLDKGTVRITRGLQRTGGELRELPTKTKRSNRTVPLLPFLVQALSDHRERQGKSGQTPGIGRTRPTCSRRPSAPPLEPGHPHPHVPRTVRPARPTPRPAA